MADGQQNPLDAAWALLISRRMWQAFCPTHHFERRYYEPGITASAYLVNRATWNLIPGDACVDWYCARGWWGGRAKSIRYQPTGRR
jgi:hypothetical protein